MLMNSPTGLVDTNILIYAENETSPYHPQAKKFIESQAFNSSLAISPQIMVEFYSIMTNPALTLRADKPEQIIIKLELILNSGMFKVILPNEKTPHTILRLLRKVAIKGKDVHDLHLAATMLDNQIETIYTADTKIFHQLGLNAINPLT